MIDASVALDFTSWQNHYDCHSYTEADIFVDTCRLGPFGVCNISIIKTGVSWEGREQGATV